MTHASTIVTDFLPTLAALVAWCAAEVTWKCRSFRTVFGDVTSSTAVEAFGAAFTTTKVATSSTAVFGLQATGGAFTLLFSLYRQGCFLFLINKEFNLWDLVYRNVCFTCTITVAVIFTLTFALTLTFTFTSTVVTVADTLKVQSLGKTFAESKLNKTVSKGILLRTRCIVLAL